MHLIRMQIPRNEQQLACVFVSVIVVVYWLQS